MQENKASIYLDGAMIKLHNKRVSFKEKGDIIALNFKIVANDATEPACYHTSYRGKVRSTTICLSNEAMEALVWLYLHYKNEKLNKP